MRLVRLLRPIGILGLCPLLGCFAYSNVERDTEDRPVVNTGVGATIIDPGRTVVMPPPASSRPASAPSTTDTSSGSLLGGASVEEVRHEEIHQEPRWLKPLLLPFTVVAWPFKKLAEALDGDASPEGEARAPDPPPGPVPAAKRREVQIAHEAGEVERMRSELASQREMTSPARAPSRVATAGAGRLSIAEELAALRAREGSRPRTSDGATAPSAPAEGPGASVPNAASRMRDRDGDGRPDHWIYGADGAPMREVFDDDGDGVPNRTVYYDPVSGKRTRVEEDVDGDGRTDSWEEYEGEQPVRRRHDSDGSGFVDSWTFFRDGVPTRHEQDTDGDGFRDRVAYFEAGQLQREEEDLDGDGRADRISYFDAAGKLLRRDEDADRDGVVDQRSFYEGGRLVRRELLTDSALEALEGESSVPRDG